MDLSITKYFSLLHYFIIINSFQTFETKLNYFTIFIDQHCALIDNASEIPPTLSIKTTTTLSSIPVTTSNIIKIAKILDPNKAHRHDLISIKMQKLCGDSVLAPLELIFKSCLKSGTFPSEWKRTNVVPVHKKGDEQSLKIITPYHYSLFVEIYLNDCYTTKYLST